ncbi:DegV family protein [Halalkalibacter sp. APA_J-10(15)]|uniref:DegV family protein n=1 Tax=Halalkalibacter sp. APA_J-10(15) TaxID=2933805 RepID=UPI001FF61C01|nr:DegV family protein [Halalkalibacter sp. APA_J-10(15)]MCK0471960.1 DegV family protein [Halalkalibacter sp. APA_J-10(15)]
MTIKIVTDSTCDLTNDVIQTYDITVVPLSITFQSETFLDGVDLTKQQFLNKLKASEELPKTSQPSMGSFSEVYERLLSDPSTTHVISIHITEGMSGTYQSARAAAQEFNGEVTVVNSSFISQALGFQVIEAAEKAKQGFSVKDIVTHLNTIREQTSLYMMVDTLDYLVKGGRIGRGRALIGSLLKIKPIASLDDGVYTPVAKVRTEQKILAFFKKKFEQETAGKKVKRIGISQVDAEKLAIKVRDMIHLLTDAPVSIAETSPIISTHTGPGALAFMYYYE